MCICDTNLSLLKNILIGFTTFRVCFSLVDGPHSLPQDSLPQLHQPAQQTGGDGLHVQLPAPGQVHHELVDGGQREGHLVRGTAADGPGPGAVRDVREQRAGARHGGGSPGDVLLRPQVSNHHHHVTSYN